MLCGRCYDDVPELFPSGCDEKPELMAGSIGMYHCPDCGAMVLAGYPHPTVCLRCAERRHPLYDRHK